MVDEALTDTPHDEEHPMTTTKQAKPKKKRAKSPGKAETKMKAKSPGKTKTKTPGKGELSKKGLPVRVSYDGQIGIRVSAQERAELVARGVADGQHSLSNVVRAALGFVPLR